MSTGSAQWNRTVRKSRWKISYEKRRNNGNPIFLSNTDFIFRLLESSCHSSSMLSWSRKRKEDYVCFPSLLSLSNNRNVYLILMYLSIPIYKWLGEWHIINFSVQITNLVSCVFSSTTCYPACAFFFNLRPHVRGWWAVFCLAVARDIISVNSRQIVHASFGIWRQVRHGRRFCIMGRQRTKAPRRLCASVTHDRPPNTL